jgi:diphthamide biosynthesis enzyme Dph1/Dph2-like protein
MAKEILELDLEIEKAVLEIIKAKAKKVCIQLPDGLKPKAKLIRAEIEKKTDAEVIIWAGSCYGACDIPSGLDKFGIDMLIQWGHSEFC